jgi:hypothetical protein
MFRALLAHPQEMLHKRHLVHCVRIMSVGCATIAVYIYIYIHIYIYKHACHIGLNFNCTHCFVSIIKLECHAQGKTQMEDVLEQSAGDACLGLREMK